MLDIAGRIRYRTITAWTVNFVHIIFGRPLPYDHIGKGGLPAACVGRVLSRAASRVTCQNMAPRDQRDGGTAGH